MYTKLKQEIIRVTCSYSLGKNEKGTMKLETCLIKKTKIKNTKQTVSRIILKLNLRIIKNNNIKDIFFNLLSIIKIYLFVMLDS
jgi:hypothetical protein